MKIIRKRTYLPSIYHTVFWTLLFFFWLFSFYFLIFILVLLYATFGLIFRKVYPSFSEDPAIKRGILFSPVSGKVLSIKKNVNHLFFGDDLTQVQISIPWWKEYGVFLPFTSEVRDLIVESGKSWFRLSKAIFPDQLTQLVPGLCVQLRGVSGDDVGLQFVKCPTGAWPEVNVLPGDRGKQQVNMGFFPFGGTLLLYIPSKYEILIKDSEDVVGGETLVAGLPQN